MRPASSASQNRSNNMIGPSARMRLRPKGYALGHINYLFKGGT